MNFDIENALREIMSYVQPETIPESYVRYLLEDEADVCDSEDELTGDVKVRLYEESGLDFPMSRAEAEEYRCEEFDDEQWDQISENGTVSAQLIKTLEDGETTSIFELLKQMPLIPAAKLISAIVVKHLTLSGVDVTETDTQQLVCDIIRDLDESLGDLMDPYGDDDDYDEDDDEDEDEDDEIDDDLMTELEQILREDPNVNARRRSRITQFPGKKV